MESNSLTGFFATSGFGLRSGVLDLGGAAVSLDPRITLTTVARFDCVLDDWAVEVLRGSLTNIVLAVVDLPDSYYPQRACLATQRSREVDNHGKLLEF